MADFSEKHYSIDAGIGTKMEGCPYSLFEDGHDVEDYIIPPKGYVFTSFKFFPTPDNQIYDGKLVAQYEKEPLKERIFSVLHFFVWFLIISAVIGLITMLTISVFNPKKPQIRENAPQNENPLPDAETLALADTISYQAIDSAKALQDSIIPAEPEETKEEEQPIATNSDLAFQQEFWALIHQRTIQMDSYDGLYKKYKGQTSGQEFDYLRFTILKDYPAYKEWSTKLRKIPMDELTTLTSVEALKNKIKEIK